MHSIVPRPEVKLVQSTVISIGRVWLSNVVEDAGCWTVGVPFFDLPVMLLLVQDDIAETASTERTDVVQAGQLGWSGNLAGRHPTPP